MTKIPFKNYISENFKNFIGKSSIEDRRKYADDVWEILQSSYAKIGGVKGSGFQSKEDMIENLPFWKIFVRNGKVLVALFYKDKSGRKTVACATDGSPEAKSILKKQFIASLGVSYGEKSKGTLVFLMKSVPFDTLKNFLIEPEDISKITGKKVTPATDFDLTQLDSSDQNIFKKYDELRDYFYVREIGGHAHLKVAFGTPGLIIVE